MSLSSEVARLATRIGQEVKGKANASHTHAAASRTVNYASGVTVTPSNGVAVDRVNITATGNLTVTPNGGTDGQVIRLNVLATGSQRTVTLPSAVRISTGLTRSVAVPTGQVGMIALEFSTLINAWVVTAVTVSGS